MKNRLILLPKNIKKYNLWTCQKVTEAHIYLLDKIDMRSGSKLYIQNVGIPMGTNCAAPPLVADLFLFCYERDFMKSLTKEKRYDVIDAFNSNTWTIYSISIIFTLNRFTKYIPLNFNLKS